MSGNTEEIVEDSSREELAAAIKELEDKEVPGKEPEAAKGPEKAPEKAPEATKEPEKAPEKAPEAAKEPEKAPEQEPEKILVKDKAPVGWNVKVREKWGELPEDVRSEILRREEASAQGVRKLQDDFRPANEFIGHLMPFIKEAAEANINPAQHINGILQAERSLRTGSDQDKFSALVGIADSYGIPLRDVLREALGKDVIPKAQPKQELPAEIQRELAEARQFRQQFEAQNRKAPEDPPQLVEFAKTHEYFQDLREDMATLAETGFSQDLQELYDEAVLRNRDIRELVQAKSAQNDQFSNKQKAATGVKVNPSNPAELKAQTEHDDNDSLEDTVRKAMLAAQGRV